MVVNLNLTRVVKSLLTEIGRLHYESNFKVNFSQSSPVYDVVLVGNPKISKKPGCIYPTCYFGSSQDVRATQIRQTTLSQSTLRHQ